MAHLQQIIIAAISSRAYVQAAVRAGFEVIAIDAFADVDTQLLAKKVYQCPVINGQFVVNALMAILQHIDLNAQLGFCYGAGFEAQPNLLTQIAAYLTVIGNSAQVVQNCKQPQLFFKHCDSLGMRYPETQFMRPLHTKNWLEKAIGGSGGLHIKALLPLNCLQQLPQNNQLYYQQKQNGMAISCLFLANQQYAQVLGFNEQWQSKTALFSYRYGGAVSHIDIPQECQDNIENFVIKMTKILGLKGINSADFIWQDDQLFALELNPRLSATLDLYRAQKGDLFAAHVAACLGNLQDWPVADKKSRAHHIVYANKPAFVPTIMEWPNWVCDIPQPNSHIAAGAPICTVLADARTPKLASQKVKQRVALL